MVLRWHRSHASREQTNTAQFAVLWRAATFVGGAAPAGSGVFGDRRRRAMAVFMRRGSRGRGRGRK